MKKAFILLVAIFGINMATAQTQETSPAQVPGNISEKFMKEHPAVSPSWKTEGKNYKAFYTDPKTHMGQLVVFDDKGNVLRQESELDKLAYPASINDYHAKNYPNEEYKLWSVQDKTGVNTFYSERNSQVLWFDKNGNYVVPKDKTAPETK